MAKKTLNEAVVRRFQKLANLSPINETYSKRDDEEKEEVEEGVYHKRDDEEELEEGSYHKRDDEEKVEEGSYMKRDDEEVMNEEEAEIEIDAEEEAPEMEAEVEGDGDLELTDEEAQAIIDLGEKLSAAMGEEAPEVGDAPAPEMEVGAEEEDELMEALADINYIPSQAEVVNEVAKRVAKRLQAAKLHEAKLNEALGKK